MARFRASRSGARRVGARLDHVGRTPERAIGRAGPPSAGAERNAHRALPARRRHAGADGTRARLRAPHARLERPRAAGAQPARLGRLRASGVGPVPARQGQPDVLDDGPRSDDRPRRRARARERCPEVGGVGHLLRRYDAGVFRQLETTRREVDRERTHLLVGGGDGRALGRRVQHRCRSGRHDLRLERAPSQPAARRDLSEGCDHRERRADDRPRRTVGVAPGARRRAPLHEVRAPTRDPDQDRGRRIPPRARRGEPESPGHAQWCRP